MAKKIKMSDNVRKWETDVYGCGKQLNKFTWGEVYYYTNRYFLSDPNMRKKAKVLELGSGTGNNLVFFASLGMDVCGIEASPTACRIAEKRLKKFGRVKSRIICEDFCKTPLPFKDNSVDLIIDRGSLTHNTFRAIKMTINDCFRILKPGGYLFSIHFFSDKDSRFGKGRRIEKNTFSDIGGNTFVDVPRVHFSNLQEIVELYRRFEIGFVEEHFVERHYPYKGECSASFDVVVKKPLTAFRSTPERGSKDD